MTTKKYFRASPIIENGLEAITPREASIAKQAFLWGVRIGMWQCCTRQAGEINATHNATADQMEFMRHELDHGTRCDVTTLCKRLQAVVEVPTRQQRAAELARTVPKTCTGQDLADYDRPPSY